MSGLSESFAREVTSTKRQLIGYQIIFYLSIALLLVSAGTALNSFPWLEGWIRPFRIDPPPSADAITLALFQLVNLAGKAILILPALLMLAFAAKRYAEVFQLKTQYTYKYTVAASLPGFKVEAPAHAEAITAAAFQQLLSNPGDTPEKKADDKKNDGETFLQRLIEPVVKKTFEKMSGAQKPLS